MSRHSRDNYSQRHEDYSKVAGIKVVVGEGERAFEKALRLFQKKVMASGILRDLRDREAYEKPSMQRKRAHALAVNRARRQQEEASEAGMGSHFRKRVIKRGLKKDDKKDGRRRRDDDRSDR